MVLGALVDAGADVDGVREVLAGLALPGWELAVAAVTRAGIGATKVTVEVDEAGGAESRPFAELERLVATASLPERVAQRSLAALRALAAAESRVHRVPLAEVHLHELGGHDTLVDVVGSAAALELLGVDEVTASPISVGMGTLRGAHGPLPNPGPAVVQLLHGAVARGRDTPVELTTPTGAALMATWATAFGPLPALQLCATGFGAGASDPAEFANCLQVVIGDRVPGPEPAAGPVLSGPVLSGPVPLGPVPLGPVPSGSVPEGAAFPGSVRDMVVVETTVDDVTGEVLAHALDVMLRAGAADAWITPVVMKRGRPGHVVQALVAPGEADRVLRVMVEETGTLGVRLVPVRRWAAQRTFATVDVAGRPVRIKVGPGRVKAEHRDTVAAASVLGLPAREVAAAAEAAWRSGAGVTGSRSGSGSGPGSGPGPSPGPGPGSGFGPTDDLRGHPSDAGCGTPEQVPGVRSENGPEPDAIS